MKIRKGDKQKIVSKTHNGHLKYQVILFNLSNAPASFQAYIIKIFVEKFDIFIIIYVDNIHVYTKDPDQSYINVVYWVLKQLRKYSLFAYFKKCRFHQDKVRFLGFVILAQGIRKKEKKIEAVKTWAKPKSIRDIQLFLDFANFY